MARKVLTLTLALCIAFLAVGGMRVSAQEDPQREPAPGRPAVSMSADHDFRPGGATTPPRDFNAGAAGDLPRGAPLAPDALGEPGTVYHFVRWYGMPETPYPEDSAHLNAPYGLWASGNHVWIAETYGRRATKFTANGVFVSQIGKSGFRHSNNTTLDYINDVGVDADGNVWIADWPHHVIKYNAAGDWMLELGQIWEAGTANNRFDCPYSLAFDTAKNVYVSDIYNHRVQVFSNAGVYLATIGVTGVSGNNNSHFDHPAKIAVDSANRLYVADRDNHRVQVFDVSTPGAPVWLMTLGQTDTPGATNTRFNLPEAVVASPVDNRIYVADTENNRIQVFTYAGVYQTTLGVDAYPMDVGVDAAGNLYVARGYTNISDVRQYSSALVHTRTYGTTGVPYLTDHQHFYTPMGVAVDAAGNIYVGEARGQRLLKLNANGGLLWSVGSPGVRGDANNRFRQVEDVDLDASGRVYAVDSGNSRVQVFNTSGGFVATLGQTLNPGGGNNQFDQPSGVAVGPDGRIFVADSGNHRVQVFNAARTYVATLGQTGVPGWDNGHFSYPIDVDVDASGKIYVVDHVNHRVQVFGSNLAYLRTIGVSGQPGYDAAHLNYPYTVAVDAQGRTFVSDDYGWRVMVFSASGAFLTSIGRNEGSGTGALFATEGLAVDAYGNLYIAEAENHRVTKFAPGSAFFAQRNIYGFGDINNDRVSALAPFGGQLYAGTFNWSGYGAQLWRSSDGRSWTVASNNGLGDATNSGISALLPFEGNLYAATYNWDIDAYQTTGAQILRSSDGSTWNRVNLPGFDPDNGQIMALAEFNGSIFAGTDDFSGTAGAEIWSSPTGNDLDWTKVVFGGLSDVDNLAVMTFEVYGGYLYAGVYNDIDGAAIWRTANGVDWLPVMTGGFGDVYNIYISGIEAFNGKLYIGVYNQIRNNVLSNNPGAELWRCLLCDATDWEMVPNTKGFGDQNNRRISSLYEYQGRLFAATANFSTGAEVWVSPDGEQWNQIGFDGLTDSGTVQPFQGENSVTMFLNRLYMGFLNNNGASVWTFLDRQIFLPAVLR